MSYIGNTNTTQAFTPAVDYFSGNASTTAFTLSRPVASVAQVQVTVNNVAQNPSSAYTISSNTITFTSAPSSGTNNIYVYYTSPITQVIAPGQNTVYPTSLSTTNALYWDTNANVGIGNTSPDSSNKLQVTGDIGLTWATDKFIGMKFGAGTSYKMGLVLKDTTRECKVWSQSSDSDDKITFYTGPTPSERMRITSAGNVGIGDNNPQSSLAVNSTSNPQIRVAYTGVHTYGLRVTSGGNFAIQDTDASSADRIIIDSSGRVTQPYQPAFFAKKTNGTGATITGTLDAIPFNATDFNIGSCFNTSTYRFTAPVSGTYFFTWNATSATTTWNNPTPAGNTVSTALYKNGTVISATDNFLSLTNSGHRIPVGGSTTIYLTANDYVSAGIPVAGGQVGDGNGANSERLSFSGYLIG